MDFSYTAEQQALREAVRSLLRTHSPQPRVRELMLTRDGYDRLVWEKMASQLGIAGLVVPDEYGGAGAGLLERGIVLEELGRSLACVPYLSTAVLAVDALILSASHTGSQTAAAEYLPRIASGQLLATVALAEQDGSWDPSSIRCRATMSETGAWRLDGTKAFVLDGMIAGLLIVAARSAGGICLFAVDAGAGGVTPRPMATLDLTRKLAEVELAGVRARLLAGPSHGCDVLRRVLDRAAIALASEQAGGALECLDMSVSYAKSREQFGRAIGSFQAVKHRCADMLLNVEAARSLVAYATWSAAAGDELPAIAGLAKSTCSDVFEAVAAETVQVHGGLGFTWEHAAHLFHKRALSSAVFLGSADYHRELFMRRSAGSSPSAAPSPSPAAAPSPAAI
jgi:alkylation response protein AidB-like acyl-CoA dehydrogenase